MTTDPKKPEDKDAKTPAGPASEPRGAKKSSGPAGKGPPVIDAEATEVSMDEPAQETQPPPAGDGEARPADSARQPTPLLAIAGLVLGAGALAAAGYAVYTVSALNGGSDTALSLRIEAAEREVAQAANNARDQAEAFDARLNAIERIADQAERIEAATVLMAELDARITGLEEDDGTAPLADRIAGLEADSAALKSSLATQADAAGRVQRIDSSVQALEAAVAALGVTVDATSQRLAALENKAETPDASARAALGLAVANLTRALETGAPFERELGAVAAFAPDDPALAALREAAATGVASRAALRARFDALIPTLLTAERQAGDAGFWSKLAANAASIVTVRRTGDVDGAETEAVVARMEARLDAGDFAGALDEGAALQGPPADVAAPWMAQVRARLDAERLIETLSARALAGFADAGAATPPGQTGD